MAKDEPELHERQDEEKVLEDLDPEEAEEAGVQGGGTRRGGRYGGLTP